MTDLRRTPHFFTTWLDVQRSSGVRLVLLEGSPFAGKSELREGLPEWVQWLELDPPLNRRDEDWVVEVLREGAVARTEELCSAHQLVVADGVEAWRALEGKIAVKTKLVYVTCLDSNGCAVDRTGPVITTVDGDVIWEARPYLAKAYRHHASDEPWKRADLHIGRIVRHGESGEELPSHYRWTYSGDDVVTPGFSGSTTETGVSP